MKHSKALLVALGFCIGALVGALFVQAQTSLSIQYLMGGIYPGAPSYTIWKEGSNYFAKNAYGQIDYSGTNASDVIHNSLSALINTGGSILLKGIIYLTSPIAIPQKTTTELAINIVGDSAGKWGQQGSAITTLSSLASLVTNEYTNDAISITNIIFKDITFDAVGDDTGPTGSATRLLDLVNADTVKFENCFFAGWTEYAIASTWAGAGTYPTGDEDLPGKIIIDRCEFVGNHYANNATIYGEYSVENFILDSLFNNGDQEAVIWIKDGVKWVIEGNQINQIANVTKTPQALIYMESSGNVGYTTFNTRDIISRGNWLYRTSEYYPIHKITESSGVIARYPTMIIIDDATAPWYNSVFSGKISKTSQVVYNGWFGMQESLTTNASGNVDIVFDAICQGFPKITVILQGNYGWYLEAVDHDGDNWHEGGTLQIVNLTDGSDVGATIPVLVWIDYTNFTT